MMMGNTNRKIKKKTRTKRIREKVRTSVKRIEKGYFVGVFNWQMEKGSQKLCTFSYPSQYCDNIGCRRRRARRCHLLRDT